MPSPSSVTHSHYHGYDEAVKAVKLMNRDQLVAQLNALEGTDNLRFGATDDEILAETLRQVEIDWRMTGPL